MTTTLTRPTTTDPSAASADMHRSSMWTNIAVFTGRSVRHSLRNPEAVLMAIGLPVILMLMFTYVFGGAIDSGSTEYVDFVTPAVILTCAGFGAATTAVNVTQDLKGGLLDRFRTMPVHASTVITGHVLASLVRNLVATAVVFGVALLIGFRPDAGFVQWLAVFGLISLWILAITYLFAAIGLASGDPEAASGYSFILLFLPYVSSGFVPIDSMPEWLQPIAEYQPLTPIIDTLRDLTTGTGVDVSAAWAVGWSLLILVIAVVWSRLAFRARAGKR